MSNQYKNAWTTKELVILKDVNLTNTEVSNLINRSYQAVKNKRAELNINAKKSIDVWGVDEIKVLVKNKDKTNIELSKLLKRTVQAIQLKRQKLNLLAPSNNWSEDELEYLVENYFILEKKDIATFLGRSLTAILSKGNEIGLSKKNDYWNKNELELLRDNFNKSLDFIIKKIPSKSKSQIIYKKNHIKQIDDIRLEEDISSDVDFFKKNKQNRMFNLLNVLNVGESFEIENKDYPNFISSRVLIKDKIFKSKKETDLTKRVWRIN